MSNKPMFTKGPWHFDKWGQVIDANGDEVRLQGVTLAGARDLTTKANTNLIAAGPELFDLVLRRVKDEEQQFFEAWLERASPAGDAESVQRQWEESSCYQDFLVEWGDEVATIAKALGEQE